MFLRRMACALLAACLVIGMVALAANVESASPQTEQSVRSDWPMLGGSPQRNLVNLVDKNLPETWNLTNGHNVKWKAPLGSESYGGPVVSDGRIYIGTNNGLKRNPKRTADMGVLVCLRETDGKFLWHAMHDKLPSGLVNDWPEQGVASSPCVEGNRLYYLSNRAELICADVEGFANGNQGLQNEKYQEPDDADFIWSLDLMKDLGVFPHNLAASSPLIVGDLVFVITGNGHDESHEHLPAPDAPSFLAVNKHTGRVVWNDNAPGKNILHAQWSSPTYGIIAGQPQVIFPGGDGWLRAYVPETGKLLWKFDCNPKKAVWKIGGKGTRNDFVAPVVIYDNKVYATVGQDPEHGQGVGHLWCINPAKASSGQIDLSPVNDNFDPRAPENARSGLVWHFGGRFPGSKPDEHDYLFRRSLSFCAIHNHLCFVADFSGYVHCLDARTGQRYWEYDLFADIWAAPLWADGKIYLGTEEGDMVVFNASRTCHLISRIAMQAPVYGTAVAANGVLYVKTRSTLYALHNR